MNILRAISMASVIMYHTRDQGIPDYPSCGNGTSPWYCGPWYSVWYRLIYSAVVQTELSTHIFIWITAHGEASQPTGRHFSLRDGFLLLLIIECAYLLGPAVTLLGGGRLDGRAFGAPYGVACQRWFIMLMFIGRLWVVVMSHLRVSPHMQMLLLLLPMLFLQARACC